MKSLSFAALNFSAIVLFVRTVSLDFYCLRLSFILRLSNNRSRSFRDAFIRFSWYGKTQIQTDSKQSKLYQSDEGKK